MAEWGITDSGVHIAALQHKSQDVCLEVFDEGNGFFWWGIFFEADYSTTSSVPREPRDWGRASDLEDAKEQAIEYAEKLLDAFEEDQDS